jgi:hypothetical protein
MAMLFGNLSTLDRRFKDDVLTCKACPQYFDFDRPLLLLDELHVAGAMIFASSFGFGGLSLVEWALLQTLDSACSRTDIDSLFEDVGPPSEFSGK